MVIELTASGRVKSYKKCPVWILEKVLCHRNKEARFRVDNLGEIEMEMYNGALSACTCEEHSSYPD